jgi:hypothetical protein
VAGNRKIATGGQIGGSTASAGAGLDGRKFTVTSRRGQAGREPLWSGFDNEHGGWRMPEQHQVDRRLETTAQRLQETLVGTDGKPAPADVVQAAIAENAEPIKDAPVQEFMPLLVENKTRARLREQGFQPDWSALEAQSAPESADTRAADDSGAGQARRVETERRGDDEEEAWYSDAEE